LAQLLQKARVSFGVLAKNEPDSGIEVYWTGHRQSFEKQARYVVNLLDQTGVKTIVTLCGEDLGMLRGKYPSNSRAPRARVLHASEFLLSLIRKGRLLLSKPIHQKVTYHDPGYRGSSGKGEIFP
jgi:Fe-S oxidoreductase